ncbi:hypothetical protein [Flavobacterium piscis]|uniref:Uncharacterized protein n=1 Tax=Flavobacterium piscis TaxID=1114874 RepID=A0ABU1Y7N8_9FLAO|nr:hypothetical protein [Flavobacterium piscis]MDR7210240.1 hypothetical protein [Flavobacterium piscis]
MKKIVSIVALTFLFAMNVSAQEKKGSSKDKKTCTAAEMKACTKDKKCAKDKKTCTVEEMKACTKDKKSCCANKKS